MPNRLEDGGNSYYYYFFNFFEDLNDSQLLFVLKDACFFNYCSVIKCRDLVLLNLLNLTACLH